MKDHQQERRPFDIYVRFSNGNGCHMSVSPQMTLNDLDLRVKEAASMHLPETYRFIFKGHRVRNHVVTLSELGIAHNSIIHIEPELTKQNQNVKIDVAFLLKGDKFVVKVPREETVWGLKSSISEFTGISPKEQTLFFLGRRLNNQGTLKRYKVGSDSLLSLVLNTAERQSPQARPSSFSNQLDLVTSVCSLSEKKSGTTKTSLFRSDSLNKKNVEEMMPFQILIREKKLSNTELLQRQHLNDLFNSCRQVGGLKESITFNSLFESAGLFKQHESFQEDQQEEKEGSEEKEEEGQRRRKRSLQTSPKCELKDQL